MPALRCLIVGLAQAATAMQTAAVALAAGMPDRAKSTDPDLASRRPVPVFVAGLAAGLMLAALGLVVARPPAPPQVWQAVAPVQLPALPPGPVLAAPHAPVVAGAPASLVPPGSGTGLRPKPRPATLATTRPEPGPTRSARNRPPPRAPPSSLMS